MGCFMEKQFKTNIDISLLDKTIKDLKINTDNSCALLKLNNIHVYIYHSSKRSGKIKLNVKVFSGKDKSTIIYSLDFNRNKDTFENQIPFYTESILSKLSGILYKNYFKNTDKTFEFGLFEDFEERFNEYISNEVSGINKVSLVYIPTIISEEEEEDGKEEEEEKNTPFIYQEM